LNYSSQRKKLENDYKRAQQQVQEIDTFSLKHALEDDNLMERVVDSIVRLKLKDYKKRGGVKASL
jgi:hypothetical protein